MYFFDSPLILLIAVIAFIYMNSKINKLDAKLKELSKGTSTPQAQSTPGSQPQTIPANLTPNQVVDPFDAFINNQNVAGGETSLVPSPDSEPKKKELDEEIGGRWLGKIGIVAVIIGVSFFLKYAFDNQWIGVTGRIIMGVIAGLAFIAVGQYLRNKYRVYGDVLSGGGIAILYLTTFAAYAFYHLMSEPVAYFFMFMVTILSGVMSVLGGTKHLAILGVFGGFLTPFLFGGNSSFAPGIFFYLLLLDLGILGVAFFKRWIGLNYLGFLGTFFVFIDWYGKFYTSEVLHITFVFLSLYFLIYLLSSITHTVTHQEKSNGGDLALITLNAAVYAYFSYILLDDDYHALLGFFALALAMLYFLTSLLANKFNPSDKPLNFYLPGIATVFLSIAMPLQFSDYWITIAWLVEAVVLYFVSFSIHRESLRIFGALVFVIGLLRFFMLDATPDSVISFISIFNRQFVIIVLAIVIAYIVAYLYYKESGNLGNAHTVTATVVFLVIANVLTLYALTFEVSMYYKKETVRLQTVYEEDSVYDQFSGANQSNDRAAAYSVEVASLRNQENTAVSLLWALYAILLIAIGMIRRVSLFRVLGLVLFFITAFKVLVNVWSLGELYRIISSIGFGLIALAGSFAYAKYRHRLKELL